MSSEGKTVIDVVEQMAIAIATARGLAPRTLPPDAIWLYVPKERALAEARAALEVLKGIEVYDIKTPYPLPMFFGDAWVEVIDSILAHGQS